MSPRAGREVRGKVCRVDDAGGGTGSRSTGTGGAAKYALPIGKLRIALDVATVVHREAAAPRDTSRHGPTERP